MVPSANVPAPREKYAVEPHTSLKKFHTLKTITYVYTFASQQGVSGGDENAEPVLHTSHPANARPTSEGC